MPELPPIQLYAILAIAITIVSIFSAFIREPTKTFVSIRKKKVMWGLLIFCFGAWSNVMGLVSYLLIRSSAVHIFDFIVHIFHFGVLAIGWYVVSILILEMWKSHISGAVLAP